MRPALVDRAGMGLVLLSPGVLVAAFAFDSGAFFPDVTAAGTLAILLICGIRAVFAERPLAGVGPAVGVAFVALACFAAWTLASGRWSHAPGRAVLEYNRVLLYLGVLALFGSVAHSRNRARVLLFGLTAASLVVAIASLAVWLLPETFPVGTEFSRLRLTWPTSYWNAAGVMAAFGAVWCLHLCCAPREHIALRCAGAAGLPLMAAVLWFSVSRGAVAVTALGVVAYVVAGRSRGMLAGLPVAAAAAAAGALVASSTHGLAAQPVSSAGLEHGRHAAWLLGAAVAGAAVLRLAALPLDRLAARIPAPRLGRAARALVAAVAVVVAAGAFFAADAPRHISHAYDRFSEVEPVPRGLEPSERFTILANNGREKLWHVALHDGFAAHPLDGTGAGTYALLWARHRDYRQTVNDGHSLYLEQLGELGLVGMALLVTCLVALLAGLVARSRGGRTTWAALLAAAVAWAVHAGVDWDWEMPATTVWVFAAGGLALSRPVTAELRVLGRRAVAARAALAMGCAMLAVVPVLVHRSQTHLVAALTALKKGDCPRSEREALHAADALPSRGEPYELLAFCDVRDGQTSLALRMAATAIRRDPRNWEMHYTQALVLAAAGRDPRAAARTALELNPLHSYARLAAQRFDTDSRAAWIRRSRTMPLPLGPT